MATGTCGWNCWFAKEQDCHCQCSGMNHGIYRKDPTAPTPQRIKRKKDQLFVLLGTGGYSEMNKLESNFKKEHPVDYTNKKSRTLNYAIHIAAASKDQQEKWPEFANIESTRYPYGLWVPKELVEEN